MKSENSFFFNVSKALVNQGLFCDVPRSHSDTPHSVGLLNPSHRPISDNTQHSQETDIHAPGGIRTRNPSKPTKLDPRLSSCGHWDQLSLRSTSKLFLFWGLQRTGNSLVKPGTLDESEHQIQDTNAATSSDSLRKSVEPMFSRLQKCM